MTILLSRDAFRSAVFARDNHRCVVCQAPAVDAHHILERRLWPDGGYYLENGASVCASHHLAAETTELSCEILREKAGITRVVLPPHLYADTRYDKWGNPYLADSEKRLPGELFHDTSVQKVLALGHQLTHFDTKTKYPRTLHFPWSPGMHADDRVMPDTTAMDQVPLVMTEKMDGENTTMYHDYIHARSTDYHPHPSRGWVRGIHAGICSDIPQGWRVCGENLYAKHSIGYEDLPGYFMVFSVWDRDLCLSWEDTTEWAALLGLPTVPVIATLDGGPDLEREATEAWLLYSAHHGEREGYVLRPADAFEARGFRLLVGKWVRKNHVQTTKHWMHGQRIEPNTLHKEP